LGAGIKVGALAKKTGLTVRTLHHYDDIGLLSPSDRTASGHRLYADRDVARLQQIASLKHLGLPLDEIKACLARPGYTLERTLDLQIERIEEQIRRHERIRDLVRVLRDRLEAAECVTVEELARTIEVTMSYEKYYTSEQLEQLGRRAVDVGEDRIREVEQEWNDLFAAFGDAMDRGLDAGSDEVQALARKSAALIAEFTGGDPGILHSLENMYRAEGGEKVTAAHGMDVRPGLWEFMARARTVLEGEQDSA
jgi:DNA-binding transcriptional MerR regulator